MFRGPKKTVKLYDPEHGDTLRSQISTWYVSAGTRIYRKSGSTFSLSQQDANSKEPRSIPTTFTVKTPLLLLDLSEQVTHAVVESAFSKYISERGTTITKESAFRDMFPLAENDTVQMVPSSQEISEIILGIRWAVSRGYLCKVDGWATPAMNSPDGTKCPPEIVLFEPTKVVRLTEPDLSESHKDSEATSVTDKQKFLQKRAQAKQALRSFMENTVDATRPTMSDTTAATNGDRRSVVSSKSLVARKLLFETPAGPGTLAVNPPVAPVAVQTSDTVNETDETESISGISDV